MIHLPSLDAKAFPPPLPGPSNKIPKTTGPAKTDADPTMRRQSEFTKHSELERASGHTDKSSGQRTGGLDEQQSGREDGKGADASTDHQEPEPGDVEEIAVAVDEFDFAGDEDKGDQHCDCEGGCVVQSAPIRAGFFFCARADAAGCVVGVVGGDEEVALGHEIRDGLAVGAEENDGVEGGEEGGEDACDDGFPCHAFPRPDDCEQQIQRCGKSCRERLYRVLLLHEKGGEEQGEGDDGDAGKHVHG